MKVVFYHTPMDPLLLTSNASWRAVIAQSFPDNRIISPPEKTFFYMADGLHFTDYSGLSYYHYLLGQVSPILEKPLR